MSEVPPLNKPLVIERQVVSIAKGNLKIKAAEAKAANKALTGATRALAKAVAAFAKAKAKHEKAKAKAAKARAAK